MEEIELGSFIRMLVKEKRTILITMAVVMLLTGVVTYLILPRQYTSTATLLYNNSTGFATSAGAIAQTLGFNLSSSNGPAPWFEMILTSRTLARKMVDKYGLVKILKQKKEEQAIDKFIDAVTVTAKPDANAFQLSVELPSTPLLYPMHPQDTVRAQMVANVVNDMVAFLDNWLKTNDYRNASIQAKYIEGELKQVFDQISQLRTQLLHTFHSGVFAPDAQAQAWLTALATVEEDVAQSRAQLSASRLAAAAGASGNEQKRLAASADLDQKAGGVGADLRKQITDLQVKLQYETEVNHKTDEHPDVALLRQSIHQLKGQLNTELSIVGQARSLEESKLGTQLGQGLGRWSKLQGQIAALPTNGLQVEELKRKLQSGADLVDMLTKQLILARITEAQEEMHFTVMDPGQVPYKQSSPSGLIGLVIAVMAGALLGLLAGATKHFVQRALSDD